ncbi:MAG TPA: M23 family metallopeptidase [Paludibacteraceae bacterium]|mgnify:FL=1|nr:M23 family metallopeptidase [Paludibacteraceae bacterium]HOK35831.1 M23 family metallopeptidase [Paludibacteraceae bacterium]HOL00216.1 M23 family metallopeptidase [Paludibacteraceae bacterium]HPC26449.1 M23 family metallopeptidase [Paludibacteraceae bacterium]
MAKKKYIFNPETLNYEPVEYTFGYKIRRFLVHTFTGIMIGTLFFFVLALTLQSPEEKQLNDEKNKIEAQYQILERQFNEAQVVLNDLQERDNNLYRVILQAEPIPFSVRRAIAGNADYYHQLLNMTNSEIVVNTTKELNVLKKQLYLQSKSYDELILLAKNKETMLQHLPAIQPVLNKDLARMASGFGWRIDPIYHTQRFHEGMDFVAPTGTEIFATGDGTISRAGWEQGYGNCVKISHGFGYETLYAHMSKIKVRIGQRVKRGDVIGLVGNTGKSTAPHLHYEVHYKGQIMNPQNYYFLDLSPEEYDRMVQMSNNSGQLLD